MSIAPSMSRGACSCAPWLLAGAALLLALAAGADQAQAGPACPWQVQPHLDDAAGRDAAIDYDIVLDGAAPWATAFYGFTVTEVEAAWRLVAEPAMPDLTAQGRPLEAVTTPAGGLAYRIAPDTLAPPTIYLVAARGPIAALEAIDAGLEPAKPVTVSLRSRGGSDVSGPLPHLSLPGVEVKTAAGGAAPRLAALTADDLVWQICAYQVAFR
jgi:hypothetical protein